MRCRAVTGPIAPAPRAGSANAAPVAGPRLVSYPEFLAEEHPDPLPWSVGDEVAPIAINYTSGTTGLPKGVIYTHRGAYLNSFAQIVHSRHDKNSVYLWTLPMFHCNGWCTPWALTAIVLGLEAAAAARRRRAGKRRLWGWFGVCEPPVNRTLAPPEEAKVPGVSPTGRGFCRQMEIITIGA
jgi:acyl-CoA synthetase (AMP-forming)/AMP-acid ligase II